MALSIIILAAGQGTRMKSTLPKVLHEVGGKPLLGHVLDTSKQLAAESVYIVYGHGGEQLRQNIEDQSCIWVQQAQQLGTGHAVNQALPQVPDDHQIVVLYGDVPLIRAETLRSLLRESEGGALAILTANLADPTGYGRIVRDQQGRIMAIVEQKDASDAIRAINEINTGFMAGCAGDFKRWLAKIDNSNSQGEFYLTDIVALAVAEQLKVRTAQPADAGEIMGINTRAQLAEIERRYQRRIAENLMTNGATLRDPDRIDVRGSLSVGNDCVIDVNCVFEGHVELGKNVSIGPNVYIKDAKIADHVEILPNSIIEGAVLERACRIGPFARIRPGTTLAANVHIGNFVELKKAVVQTGSKINHLSYVGDARIGQEVNIGAGTITCNYDGANKYETIIGDRVFVGSDTQLIAPVNVGAGATIGAGTTVTKDVPEDVLVISRVPQQVKTGWRRPTKKPQRAQDADKTSSS